LKNYFGSDIYNNLNNYQKYFFELPFEYTENNYRYIGLIDLLFQANDQWTIIDFKTSKHTPENEQEYQYQLEVYSYVISKLLEVPLDKIKTDLWYLYENKIISVASKNNSLFL
jgi:ATP-dependent exoDNAse (exonuclease V) beta subunit